MANRKFSLRDWLVGLFVLVLLLVGGNILLFRYLFAQAEGQKSILALFSFFQTSPPVATSKPSEPSVPNKLPAKLRQIAIVIDDLGYGQELANELAAISPKITLSILPQLPYSKTTAQRALQNKQEILLHLPMEPEDTKKISLHQPGMFRLNMSDSQMRRQLRQQLNDMPFIVGINNHMGSRFTADEAAMRVILSELKSHNLLFLDSLTSKNSVAYATARKLRVPALRRDIFLDNQLDKEYIRKQADKLVELAKQQGQAIGIAHPYPLTLEVLGEFIPQLEKQGIELVPLSVLLN